MKLDLHAHTHFSDGYHSPVDLIQMAKMSGLEVLAITDHDTCAAWDSDFSTTRKALEQQGSNLERIGNGIMQSGDLKIVQGIEISSLYSPNDKDEEMHFVGLFLDEKMAEDYRAYFGATKELRWSRAIKMVMKLNERGLPIKESQLREVVGKGMPNDEHIAYTIVYKELDSSIKSVREAKMKYLSKTNPYSSWIKPTPGSLTDARTAIETIMKMDGIPVWAHPNVRTSFDPEKAIEQFKKWSNGKIVVEAFSRRLTEEKQKYFSELAIKHDLKISYSTDFHGWPYREGRLGCEAPDGLFDELLDHRGD